jgi:hypothetical protein
MTPKRVVIQLVGYGCGIALLVWCVSEALSPQNRGQLAKLGEASIWEVGLLCALSVLSIILNGVLFWVAVRPVQRVPVDSVLCANAIATALNYLPFKLSMISRVLIHNRRDGVPLLRIGGWLSTVMILLAATVGPLVVVSLSKPTVDGMWFVLVGAGLVGSMLAVVLGARLFLLQGVRDVARRLTAKTKPGRKFLASESMGPYILDGLKMMASPSVVVPGVLIRLTDIGVQSARFIIAAGILGVTLQIDKAFLLAATYFGIGIVSPFGMLGTREAGAAGVADALGIPSPELIAAVVLLVSATEALVTIMLATIATIYLRPLKLLVGEVAEIAEREGLVERGEEEGRVAGEGVAGGGGRAKGDERDA